MLSAEGFNAQVLSSLDSQVAEVEDMVSYVADVLATGGWAGGGGRAGRRSHGGPAEVECCVDCEGCQRLMGRTCHA